MKNCASRRLQDSKKHTCHLNSKFKLNTIFSTHSPTSVFQIGKKPSRYIQLFPYLNGQSKISIKLHILQISEIMLSDYHCCRNRHTKEKLNSAVSIHIVYYKIYFINNLCLDIIVWVLVLNRKEIDSQILDLILCTKLLRSMT